MSDINIHENRISNLLSNIKPHKANGADENPAMIPERNCFIARLIIYLNIATAMETTRWLENSKRDTCI